uniref:Cytochrome c oxidase subunit 3 n=1 Tax=Lafontella mariadeanei TaxID=1967301 RepID=O79349_LAFMA|nr:cytochrome oxidase subunit III [Lafontella mariadeanei]
MFLFRVIFVGVSGVFLFLSLPAVCIVFFVVIWIGFMILCFGSFVFVDLGFVFFFVLGLFCILFLMCDLFCDIFRGIFDFVSFIRCLQYCFLWFVISEFVLFVTFFAVVFGYVLFLCCEFAFVFCLPISFCCLLVEFGFCFYWFYLDLFNLLINTFLLFVSGLFLNFVLFLFWFRFFCMVICFLWLGLLFGFMFLCNQLWEFVILFVTCSCGLFGSILFCIDILHFTHVFLGVFLMFICICRCFVFLCMDTRFVFLYVVVLYWHFVDCVWFFLLRFVYFDVLVVMYLCV